MATKLKNLKIKKVDFVDNGANPGASIALYKSKPAEDEEPTAEPQEGATPPEESVLKRIFRAIAKSIGRGESFQERRDSHFRRRHGTPPSWPDHGRNLGILLRAE